MKSLADRIGSAMSTYKSHCIQYAEHYEKQGLLRKLAELLGTPFSQEHYDDYYDSENEMKNLIKEVEKLETKVGKKK
jgi:hypothetical protein